MGKVKSNAQETAEAGPETGGITGENGGGTSPAAAAVAESGDPGAGAAGTEQPQGDADAGGVSGQPAVAGLVSGDDQQNEKTDQAVASAEASAETAGATDPDAETPAPALEDPFALMVRVGHALVSFVHAEAENMRECLGQQPIKTSYGEWEEAVPGLVQLICDIGDAATADVLAAQMKIDGHRETTTISATERVALDAMAMTVRRLHEIVLMANAVQPGPAANAPLRAEDSTYESEDAPGDLVA